MSNNNMVANLGQTPAEICGIPSDITGVLVLNSGPVDVVVDNSPDTSLDPQVGCRLAPGRMIGFPMLDANDHPLQLWAVAAGPAGQVTVVIDVER